VIADFGTVENASVASADQFVGEGFAFMGPM
jgi:hypothetical protein